MHTSFRIFRTVLVSLVFLYLVLLIPSNSSDVPPAPKGASPFLWQRDADWQSLEKSFRKYRQAGDPLLDSLCGKKIRALDSSLSAIGGGSLPANHPVWDSLLNRYIGLAPLIAVNPSRYPAYISIYARARSVIKQQSVRWQVQDTAVSKSLYALLYGMRSAQEEVALQMPSGFMPDLIPGQSEVPAPDSADIFGLVVHSGDILVSRGGADVSAFIARGNDYPGNFSHIALLYIDSTTHVPYLVEAHIEKGVAVSTVADYVADKKRRFMVLRLRSDHPAFIKNPQIPHLAAAYMYREAKQRHIAYDFSLDYANRGAMFCSEVASAAYQSQGVRCWQRPSAISSLGVRTWLHDFGVDHFETQMPSDLEYDPQFTVVGEWRDMETLYLDHIDNAVMDAWYERAESGLRIGYNLWKLPLARIIKGYCLVLNRFGRVGIIPEGMTATQALRNERFSSMHAAVKKSVIQEAGIFEKEYGYRPPYWELLRMARNAVEKGSL